MMFIDYEGRQTHDKLQLDTPCKGGGCALLDSLILLAVSLT